MSSKTKDPCKRFACEIQACLEAKNYQESACQTAFENLRECCAKWGEVSFVCQGINTKANTTSQGADK